MEVLKNLGLTDNEVSVYLTTLKLGSSTATEISNVCEIKRSTVYDNLKSLKMKGFISVSEENKVMKFVSLEPSKILDSYKEKIVRFEEKVQDLERLKNVSPKFSKSVFFEGLKGVLMLSEDILSQDGEILMIGSKVKIQDFYDFQSLNFGVKRIEKKIKIKILYDISEKNLGKVHFQKDKKLTKIRYLKDISKNEVISFVYGDSFAFITTKGIPTGFLIKNKFVAQQQKILFKNLWDKAER